MYLVHLRFGIEGAFGDVILVEALVVGPEGAGGLAAGGAALAVKVLIIGDWLAAEVAHLGSALASHLVAPVLLEEGLLATVANPDQSLQNETRNMIIRKFSNGSNPVLWAISISITFLEVAKNLGIQTRNSAFTCLL